MAEAMSGFAATTGEPDGPPTLRPFGLADGIAAIAAIATAFAITAALRERDRTGTGQVIDPAILEPIMMMMGAQITAFDQLGLVQPRTGNRSANNAPRSTYRAADGDWLAVSTSSQSIAERVVRLVGRDDLVSQPWFGSGRQRAVHGDELDAAVSAWIGARGTEDVLAAFERVEAAVAPVYDVSALVEDPQVAALHSIVEVPDDELGPVRMQNVIFRLSGTPGTVRWTGRRHGADTDAVLAEAGYLPEEINRLRERGVV